VKNRVAYRIKTAAPNPFEIVFTDTATEAHEQPARIRKSTRTDRAFRAFFRHLLETIEHEECGVREGADSERLHDFRVALRRTRTLLDHANKTLSAQQVKKFAGEIRWLSDATGPARDIDVHLLHFDELKKRLPAAQHANLEPLREYLNRRQRAEYQTLLETLNSARYGRLKHNWRAFLAVRPRASRKRRNAARPVGDVAPNYIAKVYGKAGKQGRRLKSDAPDTAFHDLRKTCKKLRYLLEFFKDVVPKVPVKRLIRELKDLQERLGAYQDLHIQKDFITRHRAEVAVALTDPTRLNRSLDLLIAALADDEYRIKKDCITAWQRFSDYANRKSVKKLMQSSRRSDSQKNH